MGDLKSRVSRYRRNVFGSASGASPASGQSLGEQQSQHAALSPPSTSLQSRLLGKVRWRSRSPSPSPSPSPSTPLSPEAQRHNSSTSHASQPLVVLASTPPTQTTIQRRDPGSPSPSSVQALSSTPLNIPSVRISHAPIANEDPICPSTSAAPLGPNLVIGFSPHSSRVWAQTLEIAEDKLREYSLPPLDLTTLTSASAGDNISTVAKKLGSLQEEDKKKQQSITLRGQVMRLGKILKIVDNYSTVVGTAVQSNPQVSALVWAGLRAIIQVALNHVEIIEGLEASIATLVEKVSICEFFAEMYYRVSLGSRSVKKLDCALPELYAAVIVFAAKARRYFETGGWKKFSITIKSFDIEFLPFIQEINVKEEVIRELADAATMERVREMEVALQDITSELNDISNKVAHLVQVTERTGDNTEDHRILELLKMLGPLEPLMRHQDVKLPRSKDAGEWLLRLESFTTWRDCKTIDDSGRIFCCYGIPGAGKTVTSSIVIDNLHSLRPCIGVACLYADYKDQDNQTLVHILGTFLRQLLTTTQDPIPDEVIKKLHDIQHKGRKVGFEDNLALLKIRLHQLPKAFICIDAVDELEPHVRRQLLDVLKELGKENTRLFLTGRDYIENEVQKRFQIIQGNKVIVSATQQGVEEFVWQKIEEDHDLNPDAMDEVLARDIVDTIATKSKGMFLLPTLHIKMVLGMPTRSKRRKALEMLPTDLYDAFRGIIIRIRECPNAGQAELGVRVLMWLHLAYRPLQLGELQHALAVENGDMEFNAENIPARKALLDYCLGLVIVDEETLTVRFVHYTLEEYFRENTENIWTEFSNGSSYIAETCLTYLNFGGLKQHCICIDSLENKMKEYIFLNYAALYWGNHVKQQCNGDLTKLAEVIVGHKGDYPPCAIQALYYGGSIPGSMEYLPIAKNFSGTHVMAYFGLSKYISHCCQVGQDMNLKDESGLTPLSVAAACGHESVVQILITQNDVDHDAKDESGRTPLSWAAIGGHEAVVRLLIDSGDVDINVRDKGRLTPLSWAIRKNDNFAFGVLVSLKDKKGQAPLPKLQWGKTKSLMQKGQDFDRPPLSLAAANDEKKKASIRSDKERDHGQTPLSLAAANGHEAVVRLLIEKDGINIDAKDNRGRTPLSLAAQHGHEAVVRVLIENNDIDVDTRDDMFGETPLTAAAMRGHEAVVRLLIKRRGVDINGRNKRGRTPLLWAALEGHEAVVRLLVESGVDISVRGNSGQSPLSAAAEYGREAVVRLLIQSGVDTNAKDEDGQTPLLCAAENGYEAVVRLLIESGGADINVKDNNERTPLLCAAANGRGDVVRSLIELGGVDINVQDEDGYTPLLCAVFHGFEAVVRLLIESGGDVDINAKNNYGRAPLLLAAAQGHEAAVRLLINSYGVNINVKNSNGRTPLLIAAKNGREAAARLLIERGGVDINAGDKHGRTALSWAAQKGYWAVVRLLIEGGGVDINTKDNHGRTPLLYAAIYGREAAVRPLIECGSVDINAKINNLWTPLFCRASIGHEAVVRLLIESGGVDIDAMDEDGRTALSWAAQTGYVAVVRLLIEGSGVDINTKDNHGRTPLLYAAWNGHEAVVRLLIESVGVDIDAMDEDGRTPLVYAAGNGHEAIVRLLIDSGGVDINAGDKHGQTALS